MSLLPSRLFLSEADTFLSDYRRAHPETRDQQKAEMQLWWNQTAAEVAAHSEMNNAAVAQTPYVYNAASGNQ